MEKEERGKGRETLIGSVAMSGLHDSACAKKQEVRERNERVRNKKEISLHRESN